MSFFRFVTRLLLTLNLAMVMTSCKSEVGGLGIQQNFEQRTLSNGLKVILVENHTVPLISYQTWYKVGSVDEHPGITGASHLIEHLMFRGTSKYGPKEFFLQLEAKGAEVNATATRDYTVSYDNFVPEYLEKVIDMESDRMQNLNLTNKVLDTERLLVLQERKLNLENSLEVKMQEALWQLAFRGHPYHWPVGGYPSDVLNISLEQLTQYYKNYFQPANATLVIVGDFNSNDTFKLVQKYYEKIPAGKTPNRKVQNEPEQNEERRLLVRDRVSSERFLMGYHIVSADHPDAFALDVLTNILFEGSTSRAYRTLVEQKKLFSSISGTAYTPTFPGLFIINGIMRSGQSGSVGERELEKMIRSVQENGVTQEEVQAAIKQLTLQLVDSIRSPYGLGQMIGIVQMMFDDPKRFATDLEKYTEVTPSDVKRVADLYLNPNNRSVVNLVPKQ